MVSERVIQIPVTMTEGMRQTALEAQNDVEVIRDGRELLVAHFHQGRDFIFRWCDDCPTVSVLGQCDGASTQPSNSNCKWRHGEALSVPSGRTLELETWSLSSALISINYWMHTVVS